MNKLRFLVSLGLALAATAFSVVIAFGDSGGPGVLK